MEVEKSRQEWIAHRGPFTRPAEFTKPVRVEKYMTAHRLAGLGNLSLPRKPATRGTRKGALPTLRRSAVNQQFLRGQPLHDVDNVQRTSIGH